MNGFGLSKQVLLTYMTWYESRSGYVGDLPLSLSPIGSSDSVAQTPFIVDCSYFDWQLNTIAEDQINCRDTAHTVYDAFNYHCYSFLLPANRTRQNRGLSAIFYLDDFVYPRYNYFDTDVSISQSAEIKVSVHVPGTGSKMSMAEKVGPGMETTIHVSQTKHTRLPAPYGTCFDRLNLSSVEWKEGDTVNTIDNCYGQCMQQVCLDNCRCLDTIRPFIRVKSMKRVNRGGSLCRQLAPV